MSDRFRGAAVVPPLGAAVLVAVLAALAVPIPASALATRPPVPDTLVLTHASVLPLTPDTVLRDHALRIEDGVVTWLGPADSVRVGAVPDRPVEAGAVPDRRVEARPGSGGPPETWPGVEVVDMEGAFVIPGLIDAHVHLREPSTSLALFPAAGVTTVVNLEGEPRHRALRDSVREGHLWGPRIVSSGPFLEERIRSGTGDAAAARAEVRRQARAGWEVIKIHDDLPREAWTTALDAAGREGMPTVAHRPENLPVDAALSSGLGALAHAEELLGSELLADPAAISDDSLEAVGRRVARSGTAVITTLDFFTGMKEQATDEFYRMIRRPALAYVSPERRRGWLNDGHREYIDAEELPWYEASVRALHRIVGAVHAHGGTVIAGTDTPLEFAEPGFSLPRELDHLVRAGLTPLEALRAATSAPAEFLGRTDLGHLRPGAAADLVVLDADPRTDLDALERPIGVVLRGRWHDRADLDRGLDRVAADYARDAVDVAARERALEELTRSLADAGPGEAAERVRRLRSELGADLIGEAELNALGYRLLGDERLEAAVRVFRLNAGLFPGSANVHDSLGEALLARGDLEAAERSYRRALEMDPTLDSARRALERIEERRRSRPPPPRPSLP